MSLFPSAFDSGSSSGPSRQLTNHNQPGNKRKRPSINHDDQLKSTQVNLEKLMSKLDKGDVKGRTEGRESMGTVGKKAKNRESREVKDFHRFEQEERHTPKGKGKDQPKSTSKGKNINQSPASTKFPTPKSDRKTKGKDKPSTKDSKSPAVSGGTTDKHTPAELPLPSLHAPAPAKGTKAKVGGEGLTDMQQKMQAKLEGARFRWINEQLYSTPSTEAVAMMKKDPKIFADYHMTHRTLTAGWPQPPLQHIIETLGPEPAGTVIADLGCGDAGLARALVPQGKVVLSYDLVGDSGVPGSGSSASAGAGKEGWVVEADFLEKVPLPGRPGGNFTPTPGNVWNPKKPKGKGKGVKDASEVVDVVVCCLSLMGKNWVGGIAEACRILKQGGTLHIAEVTSRFVSVPAFLEKVESFGFKLDERDEPSTHFMLFKFTKMYEVPLGVARGQRGWAERVEEGEEILRACVYKKR